MTVLKNGGKIFNEFYFGRVKLFDIVYKAVYGYYRVHMDQVMTETGYVPEGEKLSNKHASNIFFGNYMEPDADPKIYDQVTNNNKMCGCV